MGADLCPFFGGDSEKGGNGLRIKLLPRFFFNDLARSIIRASLAIGTVRGQRVEGISDHEETGAKRNLLAVQAIGIASAIPFLLMSKYDLNLCPQIRNARQHFKSSLGMASDDQCFLCIERARFVQDRVWYADLADIMDECSAADVLDDVFIQSNFIGEAGGVFYHTA